MTPYADLTRRLPSGAARWASPEFTGELTDWVSGHVGPVDVLAPAKLRVWAAVWRVEADGHCFFVKQNCQLQGFEAVLVRELSDLAPHRVVPVTAIDAERGLLLMPDQGPVLAESAGEDLDAWCSVVAAAASLQRALVPHVDRLRDLGLTTIAPEDAPSYVEQRRGELSALPDTDPRSLPPDQAQALVAHLPTVQGWADVVASLGLPVTLNHNDLHGNNVFDVAGQLRFFDFADSLLSEPLAALLVPLNVLSNQLEAGPGDPRLHRVADAALEVWSDLAPMRALRAALPAALQLARLGRVESWLRCCASMSDDELREWGGTVPQWLSTLLLEPPVGRRSR